MISFLLGLICWLMQSIFIVAICFILIPIAIFLLAIFIGLSLALVGWIISLFTGEQNGKEE